jgi:hypothetical protein
VSHGVNVVITGNHVNRTAPSGWMVRLVRLGFFYMKFELTSLEHSRLHRSANTIPINIMESPPTIEFEKTAIPPITKTKDPTPVPMMFMIQGNFEEPWIIHRLHSNAPTIPAMCRIGEPPIRPTIPSPWITTEVYIIR